MTTFHDLSSDSMDKLIAFGDSVEVFRYLITETEYKTVTRLWKECMAVKSGTRKRVFVTPYTWSQVGSAYRSIQEGRGIPVKTNSKN